MDVEPVLVNGRLWRRFLCSFKSADGTFGFEIMALSNDHALMMLAELKATATLDGELKAILK